MKFVRCAIDGEPLTQQEADPLIGKTIDRYVIREVIGSGAMGRVYLARHCFLERTYALKVLFGDYGAQVDLVERFSREAQAASRLRHANITLDRKMLSELAISDPAAFDKIVELAKSAAPKQAA